MFFTESYKFITTSFNCHINNLNLGLDNVSRVEQLCYYLVNTYLISNYD